MASFVQTLPPAVRPYAELMRLHQPVGVALLLWPALWGICLASRGAPDTVMMVLFAFGAVIMRGAGCTVNDLLDRRFDAHVARTRNRPLARGAISPRRAMAFLAVLLALGLLILLQLKPLAVGLGLLAVPMIAVYPLMKRITDWPQAFLGLTFNMSALIGYAAVAGRLDTPALLLYAACFFWTLGYDTIYAHQDKEDDLLIGVKSTALKLGDRTRPALVFFYGACAALLAASGWLAGLGWAGWVGILLFSAHLARQIATVRPELPENALSTFKSNSLSGFILFLAFYIEKFL